MRRAIHTLLGLTLTISFAWGQEKPNMVFLLADDLGWTGLSSFGSDFYETPNLDKLAAQGLKFTSAYAACTVCSPTRASILTGQYPARLRLTDFIAGQHRPWAKLRVPSWQKGLLHEHTTLAETLKASGYRTGMVGKWHLERPQHKAEDGPAQHGFEVVYQRPPKSRGYQTPKGYLTDVLTDSAVEFIDSSVALKQPFFLYMAYHVPHTPIQGRPDLVAKFEKKRDPSAVHHNATYAAMVASLDDSAGRIIKALEAHEIADNTIVIFTSDNGGLTQRYGKHDDFTENLPLRRGKGSAYEGGVRVPAIVKWPGVTTAGSVCQTPIMTIDYMPTLAKAAGAPLDMTCDGMDLRPILQSPRQTLDRDLFWHYPHYHAGGDGPYSAILSGKHRLVEFHEESRLELYDLKSDPGEQHNLADQDADQRDKLLQKLKAWREAVDAQMPSTNPKHDDTRATEVTRPPKR